MAQFVIRSFSRARLARASPWSNDDIRRMRELAQQGMAVERIAAALSRSVSAVRNKAGLHGISLRREAG